MTDMCPCGQVTADDECAYPCGNTRRHTLRIAVTGTPVAKGSMTRNRHGRIYDDHRGLRAWQQTITATATVVTHLAAKNEGWRRWDKHEPVDVHLVFRLPRPRAHLRADGTVKPTAPVVPTVRPDIDKLTRAALDALSTVVYHDDGQVVGLHTFKVYTTPGNTGLNIYVTDYEP